MLTFDPIRRYGRSLFYGYLAAVMALATWPLQHPVGSANDKVNHLAAFAVYYLLGRWSHPAARTRWLLLSGLAYGALIELVQYFEPFRQCSFWDLMADLAGLAAAWAALLACQTVRNKIRIRAS